MTDTHESVQKQYHQMMLKLSGEERLKMGCSMYDFAKEIVRNSILNQNPQYSPSEIKKAVFLRFYGNDFRADQKEKIINSLK